MELNGWEATPLSQHISALERDIQLLNDLVTMLKKSIDLLNIGLSGKSLGFTEVPREE